MYLPPGGLLACAFYDAGAGKQAATFCCSDLRAQGQWEPRVVTRDGTASLPWQPAMVGLVGHDQG